MHDFCSPVIFLRVVAVLSRFSCFQCGRFYVRLCVCFRCRFKPVDFKVMMKPFKEEFEVLFCETFSHRQNLQFLHHLHNCYLKKRWRDLLHLLQISHKAALQLGKQKAAAGWLVYPFEICTLKNPPFLQSFSAVFFVLSVDVSCFHLMQNLICVTNIPCEG